MRKNGDLRLKLRQVSVTCEREEIRLLDGTRGQSAGGPRWTSCAAAARAEAERTVEAPGREPLRRQETPVHTTGAPSWLHHRQREPERAPSARRPGNQGDLAEPTGTRADACRGRGPSQPQLDQSRESLASGPQGKSTHPESPRQQGRPAESPKDPRRHPGAHFSGRDRRYLRTSSPSPERFCSC